MTEFLSQLFLGLVIPALGVLVGSVVRYLQKAGGQSAVRIAEIVAENAVRAVEQIAKESGANGEAKFIQAKTGLQSILEERGIYLSDEDLKIFIESAVAKMQDEWKGAK